MQLLHLSFVICFHAHLVLALVSWQHKWHFQSLVN